MTRHWSRIEYADESDFGRVVIEWMLSSVCNYRCSYCPERLHDGRVRWPSWDRAQRACRNLISARLGSEMTFLFTGGEPTLYPRLPDLARYARELGARVAVLSNGSRSCAWWNGAWGWLDHAILSFHPEQAEPGHFLEVVSDGARHITIQVNLMMIPSAFDDCLAFGRRLHAREPNVVIHYKPVQDDWRRLGDYTSAQRNALLELNRATVDAERRSATSPLKGNLRCVGNDGRSELRTPTQLLLRKENQWQNWTCSVGVDSLFVRWDQVLRGVCGVGGVIGSIKDDVLELPVEPVRCNRRACNCIGGIKSLRWAPGVARTRHQPVRG